MDHLEKTVETTRSKVTAHIKHSLDALSQVSHHHLPGSSLKTTGHRSYVVSKQELHPRNFGTSVVDGRRVLTPVGNRHTGTQL